VSIKKRRLNESDNHEIQGEGQPKIEPRQWNLDLLNVMSEIEA
jgi:hypothetical protein